VPASPGNFDFIRAVPSILHALNLTLPRRESWEPIGPKFWCAYPEQTTIKFHGFSTY
jgi:hypothetical protein